MRQTLASSLVAIVVTLTACTTVTRVKGPDGTDRWYAVSCGGSKYNCYEAAAEQCPRGYIVADSGGGPIASGNLVGYQGNMLIRCKAGGADGLRRPSPSVPREPAEEPAVAQVVPAKDSSQCNAVFEHVEDTIDLWVEWFHGRPADLPDRDAFGKVCMALDEDVQLCLAAAYARNHEDACRAKLQALPAASRGEIDALLTRPAPP
jgi:hypothetical protein